MKDAERWDVPFTAEGLRFFSEYADKLGGEVAATRHDHLGMVNCRALWRGGCDHAMELPAGHGVLKVGAALAAGNAVVLAL